VSKKRLFVAVRPAEDVLAAVDTCIGARPVLDGLRWLPTANWHITLGFFGAVAEEDVEQLRFSLALGSGRVEPFEFNFRGVGAFPSPRRGRVVWVGVDGGSDRLAALATAIDGETSKRGFATEDREFRPHMTVARMKHPADVARVLESIGRVEAGPVAVAETILYESVTDSTGARYDVVDTFPLRT